MKPTGIIKIAIIVFFLLPCVATADRGKNESGKSPPGKAGFHHGGRDHGRGPDDRGPDRYRERRDYREYRGYRERPYDRGRRYGHHKHKGHRYEYRGHWRSWDEWDRYARRHPHVTKHGRYYRDRAHLMFRFCDPAGGGCFFFSIGR